MIGCKSGKKCIVEFRCLPRVIKIPLGPNFPPLLGCKGESEKSDRVTGPGPKNQKPCHTNCKTVLQLDNSISPSKSNKFSKS